MHRAACFAFAGDMTAVSGIEREDVFAASNVLLDRGLLDVAINGRKFRGRGTSNGVVHRVLRSICLRSLPFGKLFEQITVDEIIHGKPQLGVFPTHDSRRTVERALSVLVEDGYLVKFSADSGRRVFLGLNLPKVLEDILSMFDTIKVTSSVTDKALQEVRRLSGCFRAVVRFYDAIKGAVIRSLREFRNKVEGIMETLKEAVAGAVARAEAVKVAKRAKKASRPYDKDPSAALEEWNRQVEMREGDYPGYLPHATVKDKSMMKALIKEFRAKGHDDEKIREIIETVIERWRHYRECGFQASGTGYHKSVPVNPDFAFFYNHRRDLLPLLVPAGVRGVETTGKKLPTF